MGSNEKARVSRLDVTSLDKNLSSFQPTVNPNFGQEISSGANPQTWRKEKEEEEEGRKRSKRKEEEEEQEQEQEKQKEIEKEKEEKERKEKEK